MKKNVKKIHFMGIGGSACSGVSLLAKNAGFEVTGCDIADETPYLSKVKEAGIKTFVGHDSIHLNDSDLLLISPAIEFQSNDNPEYLEGKKRDILETWDKFVGDFLLEGKNVICVAGTHGKSTTSSLAGLVFEKAGLDPSVLIGAKVKEWNSTYKVGDSDFFIIEADEFSEKFLNYQPTTILLNNIEFDHPDFFKSEDQMFSSYAKFVKLLKASSNLIINMDSPGIKKLFDILGDNFLKTINIYGYTFNGNPLLKIQNITKINIVEKNEYKTVFNIQSDKLNIRETFEIKIPGDFNVANSVGVILLAILYGIETNTVKEVIKKFEGIGRRMDLIGEKRGVKVFDDYAHHPTAIRVTLQALRQKYPDNRIWVVNEPHSYSRTKALLPEYENAFDDADKVIITPIFKARDTETFGVKEEDLVKVSKHTNINYIDDFEKITKLISEEVKDGDVIIVMGAGKSYQLARDILASL